MAAAGHSATLALLLQRQPWRRGWREHFAVLQLELLGRTGHWRWVRWADLKQHTTPEQRRRR
eukprot:COSAG06_NODE_4897_length_3875_cov_4.224047_5_plen_62_part_00